MKTTIIPNITFEEDQTLEAASKRWGEVVVLDVFKSALLGKVKAFAKGQAKKGTGESELQTLVDQWKPGGVRAVKNPVDELMTYLKSCSPHELPGEIARLENFLLERKASEEG